jgi:hypothetical protein
MPLSLPLRVVVAVGTFFCYPLYEEVMVYVPLYSVFFLDL